MSNFMSTCEQRHYTNFQLFWGEFQASPPLYETIALKISLLLIHIEFETVFM